MVDIEAAFPEVLAPTENQQLLKEITDTLANTRPDTIPGMASAMLWLVLCLTGAACVGLSPTRASRSRNVEASSRPSRSTRAQARPNYSDALIEEEDDEFQDEVEHTTRPVASSQSLAEERQRRAALRSVKRTMLVDPDAIDHNYIVLCGELHASLLAHPTAKLFLEPVDFVLFPDYLQHIALPSCLRDVQERLSSGDYSTAKNYVKAVQLVLENAYYYNLPNSG